MWNIFGWRQTTTKINNGKYLEVRIENLYLAPFWEYKHFSCLYLEKYKYDWPYEGHSQSQSKNGKKGYQ